MALEAGTRLGTFEVLSPLGAGGMGEVYRARDTELGREVAVKVLPESLAGDPQRLARRKREARTLATLNHPGIATLHEVGDADGTTFLVMELVEGPTLAERLRDGALPVPEALELGRQIAAALEAAHEKAIIHRDLKPANVKLTKEGRVKLLDFGLAKISVGGAVDSEGPTATREGTAAGAVLGTPAYMSPEQARGQELDRRTDVWSFGCVLYEMLTGRRAFRANTVSDTLAGVLEHEPDWDAPPKITPPLVRSLLRRCLQKDQAKRLHDIADARIEIEEALAESMSGSTARVPQEPTAPARRNGALLKGALVAAALLGSLLAWALLRPSLSPSKAPTRLTIPLPPGVSLPGVNTPSPLALSPEGSRLVFLGETGGGRFSFGGEGSQLYLRQLDAIEAQPIPQTEGAVGPSFSPDGRWIGFWQDGKLRRVSVEGGSPMPICDSATLRGASWGPDDIIVFAPDPWSGLWSVSAAGGAPRQLTAPDHDLANSHRWPQILPDGRTAVFTVQPPGFRLDGGRTGVVSLETGQWREVLEGGSYARYVSSGHLIHGRNGTLLAAPFDLERLEVTGPSVPVLEDVRMDPRGMSVAHLEVSQGGALAYVPGYPRPIDRTLLWVDRKGKRQLATETQDPYLETALSPDGQTLAVTKDEATGTTLWLFDLAREGWTRLTFEKDTWRPVWSPDGTRLVFSSNREGMSNLYWMPVDGSGAPERLTRSHWLQSPSSWSPDGRLLAFSQQGTDAWQDIWILPLEGERKPWPLLATAASESSAVFSPDGRWIVYNSNESGRFEVYARPFPGPGSRYRVSSGGGLNPRWARDGREILFRSLGDRPKLMSVTVESSPKWRAGAPKPLFDDLFERGSASYFKSYDVSPDGQRFLMIEQPEEAPAPNRIVVVPDFASEIEQKVRAARR